jgi:hypothetical protein
MKCIVADDKKPRACNLGRMRKQVSNSMSARIIVRAISGTVSFILPCFDLPKGYELPIQSFYASTFPIRDAYNSRPGDEKRPVSVIASEAKQSFKAAKILEDCFVAALLYALWVSQ